MSWVTLAVSPSAVEELIAAAENLELYFALPHSSVDVEALADAEDGAGGEDGGDAGGNARDDAEGDRREAAGAAGKDSKASAASSASAAAGNSR